MFKPKGTPEVRSARSKLDGVLQGLVEQSEESSPIKQELVDVGEELDYSSEYASSFTPSSLVATGTPTKRNTLKAARKRKKGKDDGEGFEYHSTHHSYVMKLFDRSVDLAQFDENTPLYSVCRAWIRNHPHKRTATQQNSSPAPPTPSEPSNAVYSLPEPLNIKIEPGEESLSLRVPIPIPRSSTDNQLTRNKQPGSALPAGEDLLNDHLVHWKKVRQSWRQAGVRYEAKYQDSIAKLKTLYQPPT